MMKIGENRIEVAVFSDDTKPVTQVVSYRQSIGLLQLQGITKSEKPPRDEALTPPGNLAEVFKGPPGSSS